MATISAERNAKYKRILLKLSGEALMGDGDFGIDPKVADTDIRDLTLLEKPMAHYVDPKFLHFQ